MLAKIINNETKQCDVFLGTDTDWAAKQGFKEMDVEQAYNNWWYVAGYAPEKPAPTEEEQRQKRAEAYRVEVDPITSQISRLRDEEQTPEIIEKIDELLQKRADVVKDIQERYPYPVGEQDE